MAYDRIVNNPPPIEIKSVEESIIKSVRENLNSFPHIETSIQRELRDPVEIGFKTYRNNDRFTLVMNIEIDITDTKLTFKE